MNSIHTIYTKDKKVKITFRCDDVLGDWVTSRSGIIGLSPSAFVRQTLYQQMYAEKTLGDCLKPRTAASAETAVTNANN